MFTGCDLSVLPAPETTVAGLLSQGFNFDSDNCTDDSDLDITRVDNIVDSPCPIVVERTYTVTDDCGNSTSNFQVFFIEEPTLTLSHADTTLSSCLDQADVDAAYAAWLNNFTVTGGCNTVVTNDAPASVDACGETVTVVFVAASDCSTITEEYDFEVDSPDAVTASAPSDENVASCDFADQAAVDTDFSDWVSAQTTAIGVGGGCSPTISNDAPASGPTHCDGGAIEVTWTITDLCLDPDITYSATYTLDAAPAVTATEPSDATASSCDFADQTAVDTDFATWVSDQTTAIGVGGGCSPSISNDAPTSGPTHCDGGDITVTWTITDLCLDPDITYTATYILDAAPAVEITCPS